MKTARIILNALADLHGKPTELRHFVCDGVGLALCGVGAVCVWWLAFGLGVL